MVRLTGVFPGADDIKLSVSIKNSKAVLRRLAVELTPVLYDYFWEEKRACDFGARNLKNNKDWKLIELTKKFWNFAFTPKWYPYKFLACRNFNLLSASTFRPFEQYKTLKFHSNLSLTLKVLYLKVIYYLLLSTRNFGAVAQLCPNSNWAKFQLKSRQKFWKWLSTADIWEIRFLLQFW